MKLQCFECGISLGDRPSINVEDGCYCFFHAKKRFREILEERKHDLDMERRQYGIVLESCKRRDEQRCRQKSDYVSSRRKSSLSSFAKGFFDTSQWESEFDSKTPLIIYPRIPPDSIDTNVDIEITPEGLMRSTCVGYSREEVFTRDKYTCQNCGSKFKKEDLEVHHVLPQSEGGGDSIRNLVTLCCSCHIQEDWFGHIHVKSLRAIDPKMYAIGKYIEQQQRNLGLRK